MSHNNTTMSIRLQSAAILLLSFALIALGFGTMWARASLSIDGTVIQRHTICDPTNQARCSTTYVITQGQGTMTYVAGPNEQSLQTSLPVGTTIKKQRWQLVYTVDGHIMDDFGIGPAIGIGGFGVLLCLASCILIARPTIIPLNMREQFAKQRL